MKYLLFSLALYFSGVTYTSAQNNLKLEGHIYNEINESIPYATVVLLQASDSIISQFVMTNNEGFFLLKGLKPQKYILQVTFFGYQSFSESIDLKENLDFGVIKMEMKNNNLEEFEVKSEHIPIVIKNDTIEYNADAFNTNPNDDAESLLKKLPGVEVEKDGTVKAQGETVTKVLVDGKEFFGDDPKMATKNLPADAIEKVQVFDKKSDMSEFTGIDDGDRQKTINLILKEGKKKGYFGKATIGYGSPDDLFEGNFNINRFSKKMQLSAIGMANNINEQGFSLDDYMSFMGGMKSIMESGGWNSGASIAGYGGNSSGITTTYGLGLNLNYDFSKKTSLNTSYFYNKVGNDLVKSTSRNYFDNSSGFDTYTDNIEHTENDNHRLNYLFKHKIDSTQDLKLRGNFSFNDGLSSIFSNQQSISSENVIENATITSNSGSGTGLKSSGKLIYRKKLKKPGRNLVAEGNLSLADDNLNSLLDAKNTFITFTDTFLQSQDYRKKSLNYGGKISFTEPIGKGRFLELKLSHQENNTNLDKDFFDVSPISQAETFLSSLSAEYENVYRYDNVGLNFVLNREKYNFTIGAAAQQSKLDGKLLDAETELKKEFFKVLPSFRYDYRFRNTKKIHFSYRTRINEPSIEQLQPIVNNSNPLQIYVGNPDLLAEFSHRATIRLHDFNQFKFTSFFGMVRASYTQNKITNAVTIDSLFAQTSTPVNLGENFNVMTYISYEFPMRPLKIKINLKPNVNYNRGFLFINEVENLSNNIVSSMNMSIGNRKTEKVDVKVGVKLSHNFTNYSNGRELNQEFITSIYYTDLSWNIKKWVFTTTMDYTVYSGEAFSNSEAIPIWEASFSRLFLKNDKGQLKFKVFDILDKNKGFVRTSNLNYVQEEVSNSLGRYFMVSFTYSISGLGGKKAKSWMHHRLGSGKNR